MEPPTHDGLHSFSNLRHCGHKVSQHQKLAPGTTLRISPDAVASPHHGGSSGPYRGPVSPDSSTGRGSTQPAPGSGRSALSASAVFRKGPPRSQRPCPQRAAAENHAADGHETGAVQSRHGREDQSRQVSHSTNTSGRKCISIRRTPCPWHDSQRPPFTLKLNRPGW